MNSKLFATTALALALTTGAALADTKVNDVAPAMRHDNVLYRGISVSGNQAIASKLIGTTVYNGTAQNASDIGTVKDLVLDPNGRVAAAIIGVGGFLGLGEKNVAVSYSELRRTPIANGGMRLTLDNVSKEDLTAAPSFKYPSDSTGAVAATSAPTVPATTPVANAADGSQAANMPASSDTTASNVEANPANLKAVASGAMKSDALKGIDVISPAGVRLGSIGDFLLTKDGKVDAVVVDFGGFLGIGTKQVAIAYDGLKFMVDNNGTRYLVVNVTKDELQAQQPYNKSTYQSDRSDQRMSVAS